MINDSIRSMYSQDPPVTVAKIYQDKDRKHNFHQFIDELHHIPMDSIFDHFNFKNCMSDIKTNISRYFWTFFHLLIMPQIYG